jgi:hypothetical protein
MFSEAAINQSLESPEWTGVLNRAERFNLLSVLTGYRQACMFHSPLDIPTIRSQLVKIVNGFRLRNDISWLCPPSENTCIIIYNTDLVGETDLQLCSQLMNHSKGVDYRKLSICVGKLLGYQAPGCHLTDTKTGSYTTYYQISYILDSCQKAFHSEIVRAEGCGQINPVYNHSLDRQLSEYNHLALLVGDRVSMTKNIVTREHSIRDIFVNRDTFQLLQNALCIVNFFRNYNFNTTAKKLSDLVFPSCGSGREIDHCNSEKYSQLEEFINTYSSNLVDLIDWIMEDPIQEYYPLTETQLNHLNEQSNRLERSLYISPQEGFRATLDRFTESVTRDILNLPEV